MTLYLRPFLVALFCATSAHLLKMSHEVMSEIPYLAVSLGALLAYSRYQSGRAHLWILGAFGLAAAAFYVRTVGIALLGSLVLVSLLRREWVRASGLAVASAVLCLPRVLGGSIYSNLLLSVDPYRPEAGVLGFAGVLSRLWTNTQTYGLHIIPEAILPVGFEWVGPIPTLIVLWWIARGFWRKSLPEVYLAAYLGVILLWPQVWSDVRFLVPVIPLLFWAVVDAGLRAARIGDG